MEPETQIIPEEPAAWRTCPERRGQPGRAVRRTVVVGAAASAALGGSAAACLRLAGHAGPPLDTLALSAVLSTGALSVASCLSPHWPGVRRRLPAGHGIALTFDDGPAPSTTPYVLDALAEVSAAATFFVLGEEAARHPRLLRRIAREGHAIGIHGWDHRPMTWESAPAAYDALRRARDVVEDIAGRRVALYRPPWGHRGPALRLALRRLRWTTVGWRLAAGDWRAPEPAKLARRLETAARPRDIVLLHDAGPGAETTAAALPEVLAAMKRRGLSLEMVR